MDHDAEDHGEDVREARGFPGWFRVRPAGTEEVWLGQWRPEVSRPTYRIGGTTGTLEVNGGEQRVHVCAKVPCDRIHPESKQKKEILAPTHVRLVNCKEDRVGHEPAVVGHEEPSSDALPPPPAPPPLPPPPIATTNTTATTATTYITCTRFRRGERRAYVIGHG